MDERDGMSNSPFMVTHCLRKLLTGINIARQRVLENHSSEQSALIRRQVVWKNYIEQMTVKQNIVETCARSLKKETLVIYRNSCSFDQKGKSCSYKAGMNRLKSYKSSNMLLWKFSFWRSSSTAATRFFQLPTNPVTGKISQEYLPTVRFQCSAFVKIE